jgi:hypothetical protein
VIINGKHNTNAEVDKAGLIGEICAAYTGTKPAGCKQYASSGSSAWVDTGRYHE